MKKVKIKATTETEALQELQRIIDNSNLKEYQLNRLWEKALEKTITVLEIEPNNPYYYTFVVQTFKKDLIDRLGETMGPSLKTLLEIGYDSLPYE